MAVREIRVFKGIHFLRSPAYLSMSDAELDAEVHVCMPLDRAMSRYCGAK